MKFIKLVCYNPFKDCGYEMFVETKHPIYDIDCPACKKDDVIYKLRPEYEKGENIPKRYTFNEIKRKNIK